SGFIGQMAEVYGLRMRAEGFADDAAVWQALQERDDVVVVTPHLLPGGVFGPDANGAEGSEATIQIGGATIEVDDDEMADAEGVESRREDVVWRPFRLEGVDVDSNTLPATTIEMRNGAGEVRSLQV